MNNSESMLNELIKGIGMLTELWIITYKSFLNQKLSDKEAMDHTREFMSIMVNEIFNGSKERDGGND